MVRKDCLPGADRLKHIQYISGCTCRMETFEKYLKSAVTNHLIKKEQGRAELLGIMEG